MDGYMQSSMGNKCSQCEENFLIGWEHEVTNKKYCESCKEDCLEEDALVEKIY